MVGWLYNRFKNQAPTNNHLDAVLDAVREREKEGPVSPSTLTSRLFRYTS